MSVTNLTNVFINHNVFAGNNLTVAGNVNFGIKNKRLESFQENFENLKKSTGGTKPNFKDKKTIDEVLHTVDSEAMASTDSSIITGHMYQGVLPSKCIGSTKVSSTPLKKDQYKLDNFDKTKSSIGEGLYIGDLTAIHSNTNHCDSNSEKGKSIERDSIDHSNFFSAIPIFNGNSQSQSLLPGKPENLVSHVSFTTDDLLESNPCGKCDSTRTRSKSLPRDQSREIFDQSKRFIYYIYYKLKLY